MFNSKLSRFITAAATATALTVAVAAPASAASWQWHQTDRDACWDAASLDSDGNGYAEQVWFDIDNDCRLDTRMFNTQGHDSFHEWVSFDMNEDGWPEYWLQDTNQSNGYEFVHYDTNRDGRIDITRSTSWSIPYLQGVIGSPTYSGVPNLLLTMARLNGTVAWG